MAKYFVGLIAVVLVVCAVVVLRSSSQRERRVDHRLPSPSGDEAQNAQFAEIHDDLGLVIGPDDSLPDLARVWASSRPFALLLAKSTDKDIGFGAQHYRQPACPACGLDHVYHVETVPQFDFKPKTIYGANIPTH